ncbi:toxin-antitoxin system HicB family antitoxin [Moraxella bovoculi]|uniref:toxin-antitoxin system HicB family antitoxin n=1 Tax=Moraxella bovoculi TaxID=386891 RepID=UPI0018B07FD3|nr:toxin-antitoxin system HicB family antitoxin [Moraxella bovoculi]
MNGIKKRALPIVFCRTPAKRTTPKKIAETATAQGISLNQWVNQALSREVIA